ncbi:hypothetical protein AKJ16_DCAP17168 [Drosera capensis]
MEKLTVLLRICKLLLHVVLLFNCSYPFFGCLTVNKAMRLHKVNNIPLYTMIHIVS